MNYTTLLAGLVMVAAASALPASDTTIAYDSIAVFSIGGPPTVPIISIVRNTDQLSDYCTDARCDTALLPVIPDFTTSTVIGLLTMTGGGNRVKYRMLQRILDDIDSVVLEIRPDSQIYDPGISIQAAYRVYLFAIPKTDKPVALKECQVTAIRKPAYRPLTVTAAHRNPGGVYDISGRSLQGECYSHVGLLISTGKRGPTRILSLRDDR